MLNPFACVVRRERGLSSLKRLLSRTEIHQTTDHGKQRTLPFTRTFRGCPRVSARRRNILHLDILYVSHLLVGFGGCKCKQKVHKSMFDLSHFSVICILTGLLSPPVGRSGQRKSWWFMLLEDSSLFRSCSGVSY